VAKKERSHADDLRGATRLVVEATRGVMELVEAMQVASVAGPAILGLQGPAKAVTGIVYGTSRGITQLVGSAIDVALERLGPLLGGSVAGPERDAVLGALNGVLGDYLHEHANPLAIEMRLRRNGEPLDFETLPVTSKIVVLVHGSCATDRLWNRNGHDHGAALARDFDFTPVYVHYNSGLHISTNGRSLAALLDQLVTAWPVEVTELVLLGHSMGGLVARSACHLGESHAWRTHLSSLITLGAPHHGAPLERGGSWLQLLLGVSRFSAPFARLGRIRSAGITDLRFGNVLDEHWEGRDRFAVGDDPREPLGLPAGVRCYAVAASQSLEHGERMRGDGVVPVDSALGTHAVAERDLGFPAAHTSIVLGTKHLDLLAPPVYEIIRRWLA
jgi:pimeloyl-ACP methyl ester carboxylesterase